MQDVTSLLNCYRECVRNLWNTYFVNRTSTEGWDLFDEYDNICVKLFASLVLNEVDKHTHKKSSAFIQFPEPLLFLHVVPSAKSGIPVNICRKKGDACYWDNPTILIKPDETDMRFIDFFDFDLLGFRDFQYCRARILSSNVNSDIVGLDALLLCNYAKIFLEDDI